MRIYLLTYADEKYEDAQSKLNGRAGSIDVFDAMFNYHRKYLIQTDFYRENKYILDKPKGSGYCLWKPCIILNYLNNLDEGDVLLYMDSADFITNADNMREAIINEMADKDMILTAGAFKQSQYTKRDCFVYMFCDEPKYWDAIQLEAGICLFKNTEKTRKFVAEWLNWCKVSCVITDDPNVCNLPNFSDFIEGRYDQAILTNLQIKHGIQPSDFLRQFITCNYNKI